MRTNIVIDDKLLDATFDAASFQITHRVHEKISSQGVAAPVGLNAKAQEYLDIPSIGINH